MGLRRFAGAVAGLAAVSLIAGEGDGDSGGIVGRREHEDIVGRAQAQVGRLERDMESLARELEKTDEALARRIEEALSYLRQTDGGPSLQEKLQGAIRHLGAGADGSAREVERAVIADIDRILEILAPSEKDWVGILKRHRAAAAKILDDQGKGIGRSSDAGFREAVDRAARRLGDIRARQDAAAGEAAKGGPRRGRAEAQDGLARETRSVAEDLDRAAKDALDRKAGGGEAASCAAAEALAAAGKMDEAAKSLAAPAGGSAGGNPAAGSQKDAIERLDAALAKLRPDETRGDKGAPPASGREIADDQEALSRRTAELTGKMRASAGGASPAQPAAEALEKAAAACGAAISPMGSAASAAASGKPGEMGTARRFQVEALNQVQDAVDVLGDAIERAEREMSPAKRGERILWLISALRKARVEEEAIWKETKALDGRKRMLADRIFQGESGSLARRQGALWGEVAEVQLQLEVEGAPVYAAMLEDAADGMERAARRLARFRTDEPTRTIEQEAIRTLDELIAGLQDERLWTIEQTPPPPGPPGPPPGPHPDRKPPLVRDVAQVRLLRVMEARVKARVEAIESSRLGGETGDGIREELAGTLQLQRKIVHLARSLGGKALAEARSDRDW